MKKTDKEDIKTLADSFAKTRDEAIINQVYQVHGKRGLEAMAEHAGYMPVWAHIQEGRIKLKNR